MMLLDDWMLKTETEDKPVGFGRYGFLKNAQMPNFLTLTDHKDNVVSKGWKSLSIMEIMKSFHSDFKSITKSFICKP